VSGIDLPDSITIYAWGLIVFVRANSSWVIDELLSALSNQNKSSTVVFNERASRNDVSVVGTDFPDSMAIYACRLMPIALAILVCVKPAFFLMWRILLVKDTGIIL
jgi:hypothetical protein